MPPNSLPEPWNSFFTEIDAHLNEEFELRCLGGFVMTVLYSLQRPTSDVDILRVGSLSAIDSLIALAGEGSELHQKYKVYLQVVGVASVPDDYDDRLIEMSPAAFKRLRLSALDPYDLALSKLERNTQRDRDDVLHLARTIPLDLDVLRKRYERELRLNLGNPKREDLTLQLWVDAIEEDRQGELESKT